jgi:predicted ATPase
MIFIDSIKNKESTRLPKDLFIQCEQLNLLVGDQGVGKSTLLKLLHSKEQDIEVILNPYTIEHGVDTFFFDTEKNNPRTTSLAGINDNRQYRNALVSHFQSHGEVLVDYTVNALEKAKDCIVFLDEPESSLSIKNQFRLIEAVNRATIVNNCQLFVATHCYPLIQSYRVFSLEHNKWMNGRDYLKTLTPTWYETI